MSNTEWTAIHQAAEMPAGVRAIVVRKNKMEQGIFWLQHPSWDLSPVPEQFHAILNEALEALVRGLIQEAIARNRTELPAASLTLNSLLSSCQLSALANLTASDLADWADRSGFRAAIDRLPANCDKAIGWLCKIASGKDMILPDRVVQVLQQTLPADPIGSALRLRLDYLATLEEDAI